MTDTPEKGSAFRKVVQALLLDVRERAASRQPLAIGERPAALSAAFSDLKAQVTLARARSSEAQHQLYAARREAILTVVAQRETRLRAYAARERVVVPAEEGKFIIAGRVTDTVTGIGPVNVLVRAFDLDRKYDDLLGSAHTDALGYFRIEYAAAAFQEHGEGLPEVYIEVLDHAGNVLFTSPKSFAPKVGATEFIAATVDGGRVPDALAVGRKIQRSVDRRIRALERRGRELRLRSRVQPSLTAATRLERQGVTAREELKRPLARPRVQDSEGAGPRADEGLVSERVREPPGTGEPPTAPRPTVAPAASARRRVDEVPGIGGGLASRLAAHGITHLADLAAVEPARLAQILEVSEQRAVSMIDNAKRLLTRGPTE